MSDKVKLRATLTWEYEADPEHYDSTDPAEMASIDKTSFLAESELVLDHITSYDFDVEVKPA